LQYPGINKGNISKRTGQKPNNLSDRLKKLTTNGYLKTGRSRNEYFAICMFPGNTLEENSNIEKVYTALNNNKSTLDLLWKAEKLIHFIMKIQNMRSVDIKKMIFEITEKKVGSLTARIEELDYNEILTKEGIPNSYKYTYNAEPIDTILKWHEKRKETELLGAIRQMIGKGLKLEGMQKKTETSTIDYYKIKLKENELTFCTNPMNQYLLGGLKEEKEIEKE
jgi:DNA-binding Lrp family transcriptional regulator